MSLNIPDSAQQIFNRMATDIVNELNELDPFLRNSLIRALSVSMANAFFEIYKTIDQLEKLVFWDTTEGDSLVRWAAIFGITKNPATIATGFITLTGIPTSSVPLNTQLTSVSGGTYETTSAATITNIINSVSSIDRVGQTASVVTTADHGLSSNMEVDILGAVETEYNGTFNITVTSASSFTYTVSGSPSTPATGTITADADYANIPVQSLNFGSDQNLESGASVSLASPIAGVNNEGYVSFEQVSGGADVETDESLRDRFLFRVQNPISLFNENAIIDTARGVSGVTRVWVQTVNQFNDSLASTSLTRSGDFATFTTATPHGLFDGQTVIITGAQENEYNRVGANVLVIDSFSFGYVVGGDPPTPDGGSAVANFSIAEIGQVRVFFVRDNDDITIIPSPGEVASVKNALLAIKPAPMNDTDLIVAAPVPVVVDFTFTTLTPNTTSMQLAVTQSLESFFASNTNVAENLQEIDYNSVINSTLDSGGNPIVDFTLSTPVGDIAMGPSDLPVLGTVTYP